MAYQVATAATGVIRDAHYAYAPTMAQFYRSLLLEQQRTNICLYSEDLSNAAWVKTDSTITANATTGPDGAATADLVTEGTAGTAQVLQAFTVASGATYAHTKFLKAGATGTWVCLAIVDNAAPTTNFVRAWFNLSTGAAGSAATTGGTGTAAAQHITPLSNGWYKCTVVGALTGITAYSTLSFSASADASVTRVNSATRYEGGAQMEAGSSRSSYIPTTTVAVTRNADSCYFDVPSLVPREMTVYVRGVELLNGAPAAGTFPNIFAISSAANAAPRIQVYRDQSADDYRALHQNSGTSLTGLVGSIVTGALTELRLVAASTGAVTLGFTADNGTETVSTSGAAEPFASAWSATRLYLNSAGTTNTASFAFTNVAIALGTQTRATMRGIAGVS